MPSSSSSIRGFHISLQPALAWTAILALVLFSAACILAGAGKILNLAFPVGAFAVAALLYFRYPILYIGFSWWMLFLVPLVRRLVDYRSGFTDPSPILLAPYLVMGLTLVTFWRDFPKAYRQGGLPFVLSLVGVFYGFLIGLLNKSPMIVARAALDWMPPVAFGFHLSVNWRNYPSYRQNIQRTFLWGVLVMGVYGILQFVVAPDWDTLWLKNAEITSVGRPEPFGFRIWSTMNSPEPFAAFMAAALLLLFTTKGVLSLPASGAGYLALLLTTVRSAWIGWFAGLLTLITFLKAKHQMRLVIIVIVIATLVVPLTTIEPISQTLNARFETFSNLEEDGSAQARKETYQREISRALTSFLGEGIGDVGYDSAFLDTLISLGWLGTIFYMGGMLLVVFSLFQSSEGSFDPFTGACRAIVISALVRLPVNGSIFGVSGVVFWGFLGMGMAANKYYQHQRTAEPRQILQQNSPKS